MTVYVDELRQLDVGPPAVPAVCVGRLGDNGTWCDTHGGVVATCTVCGVTARVDTWVFPIPFDETVWLIGEH